MTTTPTTTSSLGLLDASYRWTTERVGAITRLDVPTPCTEFDLAALLDHLNESLQRFTAAITGGRGSDLPADPIAAYEVAQRDARSAWETADLGRTFVLPIGEVPGELFAMLSATEVVVHGWDVSRATGEDATIPADLAEPLLGFTVSLLSDMDRGDAFAPAVPGGTTPSERLARFLGRA